MADVDKLYTDYIAEHKAGGKADPLEYLNQVEGVDRDELTELIDAYLARSPGQAWDAEAYAGSSAERAAESVARSLEGVSGWWPTVLPRMRAAARLTRAQVVERLSASLGATGREEKVAGYYHQMEQGSLPAEGVSRRVLEALSEVYGSTADRLRELGEPMGSGPSAAGGAAPAPAMARVSLPDERYTADASDAEQATPVAPAQRDEIDELFTGGS